MLTSELIAVLQQRLAEYGDLPVAHVNDWSQFLVRVVRYVPELPTGPASGWPHPIPAHLELDDVGEAESGEYPSGFGPPVDEAVKRNA